MAACCLGISGWFALKGLWLPLPFAGAELLALGLCWRHVLRTGEQRETIDVDPEHVVVRRQWRDQRRRRDFQTHWLRVELARGVARHHPRRLLLGSHGRRLEVGRFLTDQERERLFGELNATLSAVRY